MAAARPARPAPMTMTPVDFGCDGIGWNEDENVDAWDLGRKRCWWWAHRGGGEGEMRRDGLEKLE